MAEVTKELIITAKPTEVQIALLEDKKLVELHQEKLSEQFCVGNVYLGKVRKIMPGLNAAFVNIGSDKDAFLHYLDICPDTLTLNEFVKNVTSGGKRSLSAVTRQPAIEKSRQYYECAHYRADHPRTNCQREHFHQRATRHYGCLLRRPLLRARPLRRQSAPLPENQRER